MIAQLTIVCVLALQAALVSSGAAHDAENQHRHDQVQREREMAERELVELHERIRQLEQAEHRVPKELLEMREHLKRQLQPVEENDERFVEEVLEWVLALDPDQYVTLLELRETNPQEFRERLGGLMPWLEEMRELRHRDSELYELERQSHHLEFNCELLARRARDSAGEPRRDAEEELGNRLRELFELRLTLRRVQIERLEEELADMRRRVEKMSNNADELIARRLRSMLGEEDEW